MKKYKKHFIGIFVIIIMSVFTLGTSPANYTEVTLQNSSSQNLKFVIISYNTDIRYYSDYDDYEDKITREFSLNRRERTTINRFSTGRTRAPPDKFYLSIIIYNKNNEMLKEYNIDNGNISELIFQYRRRRTGFLFFLGGTSHYTLRITDELLE